jgi:hypothetical protein
MSPLVDGLSPDGVLLVPAAPAEPLMIRVMPLIMGRRSAVAYEQMNSGKVRFRVVLTFGG